MQKSQSSKVNTNDKIKPQSQQSPKKSNALHQPDTIK
jgi:hypothetical protein